MLEIQIQSPASKILSLMFFKDLILNKRLIASNKKKLVKIALLSPKVSGKTTKRSVKKRIAKELDPVSLFRLTTKSTIKTLNKRIVKIPIDGSNSTSLKVESSR